MSTAPGETLERHTTARPGAIVLARHGRPKGDRRIRLDWRGYEEWWAEYDRAGLVADQFPPENLTEAARDATQIFASPLPRALETAQALAAGRPVTIDPIFIEAPMPPPPVWGKRTPRAWGVWARVAWWLGRSAGQESRKEAEQRAEAAVATLTARALRGETVVLCAHGWFNRMMRPVLKRQGWAEVEDHGDKYWSYRRYERRR
ncbi:MAG: histidine phosphatase family protein [Caulobacterales bacterium]